MISLLFYANLFFRGIVILYADKVSSRDNNSVLFIFSYIIFTIFTLLSPSLTVIIGVTLKSNFPYNTLLGRICLGIAFSEERLDETALFEPRIRICIFYALIGVWILFIRQGFLYIHDLCIWIMQITQRRWEVCTATKFEWTFPCLFLSTKINITNFFNIKYETLEAILKTS